jgi:hypothetical protein
VQRGEDVNGVRIEELDVAHDTLAVLAVVDPARTDANTMAARWRCSAVNLIFYRR